MTLLLLVCDENLPPVDTLYTNKLFLGGSAKAGGELIQKMGGELLGFIFLLELEFLHGRDKLPAPVYTLLSGQA